jgi:hypothetical protein
MIEPGDPLSWLQFATGEQSRAKHASVRTMPGEAYRGVSAQARQDVLERDAPSGLEQEHSGARSVAPDNDLLRIKGVDRVCDRDADPLAPDLDHARGGFVAV